MAAENDVIVIGDLHGASAGPVVIDDKADENPLPKGATLNDDGTVTLTLRSAVVLSWRPPGGEVKEDRYQDFVMHRLKGKDMLEIQNASKSDLVVVAIAQSVRIPKSNFRHIFERMDAADIQAAGGVISYFLNNGPRTGP